MITLQHLRIFIVISWIIYLSEVLSFQLYDPTIYSPILHLANILLADEISNNAIFYFLLVFEAFFLIYASAALWLGYKSGKWAFVAYLILSLTDNYFLSVQAYSWLDELLENINFLIFGMICLSFYTSPLKEQIAAKKAFKFWHVLGLFFLFFILFFALPISLHYWMNR